MAVEQVDRDCLAARYRELCQPGMAEQIEAGEMDDHPNLLMLAAHRERERERCAGVCDGSAERWRSFASMGLPAMPDPAVCKVFATKAEELATAIREGKS